VDNYEISGGGIILEAVPDTDSSLLTHIREREFLWEKSLISASKGKMLMDTKRSLS